MFCQNFIPNKSIFNETLGEGQSEKHNRSVPKRLRPTNADGWKWFETSPSDFAFSWLLRRIIRSF